MTKEVIPAKRVIIETKEEKMVYDSSIVSVFKVKPDSRGRIHVGTGNRCVVIELKGDNVE